MDFDLIICVYSQVKKKKKWIVNLLKSQFSISLLHFPFEKLILQFTKWHTKRMKKTKDKRMLVGWRDRSTEWKTGHSVSINFCNGLLAHFSTNKFVNKNTQLATSLNSMNCCDVKRLFDAPNNSHRWQKCIAKKFDSKWVIERIFNLSMQFT